MLFLYYVVHVALPTMILGDIKFIICPIFCLFFYILFMSLWFPLRLPWLFLSNFKFLSFSKSSLYLLHFSHHLSSFLLLLFHFFSYFTIFVILFFSLNIQRVQFILLLCKYSQSAYCLLEDFFKQINIEYVLWYWYCLTNALSYVIVYRSDISSSLTIMSLCRTS